MSELDQIMAKVQDMEARLDNRKSFSDEASRITGTPHPCDLTPKRTFSEYSKGLKLSDGGKVISMDWNPKNPDEFVTLSQAGSIITFDSKTTFMSHFIARDEKLLDLAYDASGTYIATGGLDNTLSIYQLQNDDEWEKEQKPKYEFKEHDACIECISWISPNEVITGSDDKMVRIFDVTTQALIGTYSGHLYDVSCLSVMPDNPNIWVTGSASDKDGTCRLWDRRASNFPCVVTYSTLAFSQHDDSVSGVNAVSFMSHGHAFGCGNDRGDIRIFDTRKCYNEMQLINTWNTFEDPVYDFPQPPSAAEAAAGEAMDYGSQKQEFVDSVGVTSMCFSQSGRLVFSGHGNGTIKGHDIVSGGTQVWSYNDDSGRARAPVSCLRMRTDGKALGCSWKSKDVMVQIFA